MMWCKLVLKIDIVSVVFNLVWNRCIWGMYFLECWWGGLYCGSFVLIFWSGGYWFVRLFVFL